MSAERLTIFDTTLRDGEQAPGFSMRIDEKLKLARQLATLGVDIIEAGFPITSEADAEAVHTIASEVQGPVIAGLARCRPADIDRAGESLQPPRAIVGSLGACGCTKGLPRKNARPEPKMKSAMPTAMSLTRGRLHTAACSRPSRAPAAAAASTPSQGEPVR